jgi:hypothetical protein
VNSASHALTPLRTGSTACCRVRLIGSVSNEARIRTLRDRRHLIASIPEASIFGGMTEHDRNIHWCSDRVPVLAMKMNDDSAIVT